MKNSTTFTLFAAFLISACAAKSNAKIFPMEGGNVRAISSNENKDQAENDALDAANKYCKDQGKTAIFKDPKSEYQGTLGEKGDSAIKKAGELGNIFGTGKVGDVGRAVIGSTDYKVTLEFRCQ